MSHEPMDVDELAAYLKRDARDVHKLASKGLIPGRKVAGEWRFQTYEINLWLQGQLIDHHEDSLIHFESHAPIECEHGTLISKYLGEPCIASPLPARTKSSALRELIKLAEQSWQIYDPDAIHKAISQREEIASTALAGGVAIPHPHRPIPGTLGETVIALGIIPGGIPFGAPDRKLTDVFFLVCPTDDKTHIQLLARLTRLFLTEGFLESIRETNDPKQIWQTIRKLEMKLG